MTSSEWNKRQRARFKKAGKCRCGGKRVPGRMSCGRCIAAEKIRRDKATLAGQCSHCRRARATVGKFCILCRASLTGRRRLAARLLREHLKTSKP